MFDSLSVFQIVFPSFFGFKKSDLIIVVWERIWYLVNNQKM